MTPDLDQSLSLKAQLADKVSPQLQKIKRAVKSTRDAISEMVSSVTSGGERMGATATKMGSDVQSGTAKVKEGLDSVSESFRETGDTATQSSQKIGKAIEDAMYTQGASSRIDTLEKDLGTLDKTFKGMASRQRGVSGKARSISATASDSLNKKVIPAFQELHSTLDDYPDTLEDINKLEEDRMKMLEEGGTVMERMKGRMQGAKEAVDEIQMGIRDAVSVAAAGTMGVVGSQVQEHQTGAAQIAGAGMFDAMPGMLADTTKAAQTTMDNVRPILDAVLELRSTPKDVIGPVVAEIYNMQKATGLAGEEIVTLRDRMTRLGGLDSSEFTMVMDKMAFMAQETGADMSDMFGVMQTAGDQMIMFSRDARTAFVESSLAAAASAKTMGLDSGTGNDMLQQLYDSPEQVARVQGIFSAAGMDVDVQQLMNDGDPGVLLDKMAKALPKVFGEMNMRDAQARQAFTTQTGMDPNLLLRLQNNITETGEGTGGSAAELVAKAAEEGAGTVAETAERVRGTQAEETEQLLGQMQRGFIEPGRKTIEMLALVTDDFGNVVGSLADTTIAIDEYFDGAASTFAATAVASEAVITMAKGTGIAIGKTDMPGSDLVEDIMTGQGVEGKTFQAALVASVATGSAGMFHGEKKEDILSEDQLAKIQGQLAEQGYSEAEIFNEMGNANLINIQNRDPQSIAAAERAGVPVFKDVAKKGLESTLYKALPRLPGGPGTDEEPEPEPTPSVQDVMNDPSNFEAVQDKLTQAMLPMFEGVDLTQADAREQFKNMTGGIVPIEDFIAAQEKAKSVVDVATPTPIEDFIAAQEKAKSVVDVATPTPIETTELQESISNVRASATSAGSEMDKMGDTLGKETTKQTGLQEQTVVLLGKINAGIDKINTPDPQQQTQVARVSLTDEGDRFLNLSEGRV